LEKSEVFNNVPSVTSFANVVPVDDWMTDPRRALKIYKSEPELIGFAHDSVSDTANIT
jgi:hypothetical protein